MEKEERKINKYVGLFDRLTFVGARITWHHARQETLIFINSGYLILCENAVLLTIKTGMLSGQKN